MDAKTQGHGGSWTITLVSGSQIQQALEFPGGLVKNHTLLGSMSGVSDSVGMGQA